MGLPENTGYDLLKRQQEKRRLIMLGLLPNDSFWSKVIQRFNFYQKISEELRKEIDKWIHNHRHVIHLLNVNNTILVRESDSPGAAPIPKVKLLLQCTTDELLDDLYAEKCGMGEKVIDKNGNKLVSSQMLLTLFPPGLKFVSNCYKQFCCCECCFSMDYLKDSLNQYRYELRKKSQAEFDSLPEITPSQKRTKHKKEKVLEKYKLEAFENGKTFTSQAKRCNIVCTMLSP